MRKKTVINLRRLEELLAEKKWGPGELAQYSGVKYDTIYSLKVGRRSNTSISTLKLIAAALDTTTDYLLGETEDRGAIDAVPQAVRQLTDIALRLSDVRRTELVRIADALEAFEQEQAESAANAQGWSAVQAVLRRRLTEEEYEALLDEFADTIPEFRHLRRPQDGRGSTEQAGVG